MNIHSAVERGKLDIVQQMLHDDPKLIHSRSSSNDQPLHITAWQKKTKIAELLITLGADLNAHGDQGRTPLHYAVESDSKQLVELLIRSGANSQLVNSAGLTPLYLAASTRSQKIVDAFVKLKQPVDLASSLYIEGPDKALERLNANPDLMRSIRQPEILMLDAIRLQSLDLTRFLLKQGVDPNRKLYRSYPLLEAISHRNIDLVRILLENGADVSLSDFLEKSLLKFSEVYGGTPAITELLRAHGAT